MNVGVVVVLVVRPLLAAVGGGSRRSGNVRLFTAYANLCVPSMSTQDPRWCDECDIRYQSHLRPPGGVVVSAL